MCCFSRPVEAVSGTTIFARPASGGRQLLAYAMRVKAVEPLAMVLPLPTPPRPAEDAVRFIALDKYPTLFADLAAAFVTPPSRSKGEALGAPAPRPGLAVVEVGSFVASFVPTLADFARLDEQFRMPPGTWEGLPQYKGYGFAVFQLKPGDQAVHPMAFEFPRADPRRLFFPTVHVHDGKVHPRAGFDHMLYAQPGKGARPGGWEAANRPVERVVDVGRAKGLVAAGEPLVRRRLAGRLPNADTYL